MPGLWEYLVECPPPADQGSFQEVSGQTPDLAGRVARPVWTLVRLLAWDLETWRGLWPQFSSRPKSGSTPLSPPRPARDWDWEPVPGYEDKRVRERALANELLDICEQFWGTGEASQVHWVLSPDGYNAIRKLRDANGHYLMTQAPFRDAKLLGWPVKISYETHEPWALCGRAGE